MKQLGQTVEQFWRTHSQVPDRYIKKSDIANHTITVVMLVPIELVVGVTVIPCLEYEHLHMDCHG
jgi:hypothetical protein